VDEPVTPPPPRPRWVALAPLRNTAYARLWFGAFVSNIGTWMEAVALGIYVQRTTGQAAWTGTVAAAAFVPIAIVGPFGGALADRFPRKWLLVSTSAIQLALAALLAALFATGSPSAPLLTLIAFANGTCAALGFPAYQAILPDLVPTEILPGAVALSAAQYNLGRVVGPVLAGVVIGTDRYAAAEAVNAVSFLAVIAVMITLPLPRPVHHEHHDHLLRAVARGFGFVRREPGLRINALAMCVNTFLAAPFIALVPTMAEDVLDTSHGTAVLVTAQGVGAVAMAFSLGWLSERWGTRRVLLTMMGGLPFALAAYARAPGLALSACAIVAVGGLYLGAISTFTTIAQLRAPAALRGRVVSVHTMILGSLYPIGAVVQGAIADAIGLRVTTLAAGVALGVVLVVTRLARPGITEALDEPVALASGA